MTVPWQENRQGRPAESPLAKFYRVLSGRGKQSARSPLPRSEAAPIANRRRTSRHQLREPNENQDFPDDLAFGVVGLVGLPLAEATPAGDFGDMTDVWGSDF
jgi:hypothetical protein